MNNDYEQALVLLRKYREYVDWPEFDVEVDAFLTRAQVPQQQAVAWIADIAAYADHLPFKTLVFDKRELDHIRAEIVWTPLTVPQLAISEKFDGAEALRALLAIAVVGKIDDHDVIRRESVRNIMERRLIAAEPKGDK